MRYVSIRAKSFVDCHTTLLSFILKTRPRSLRYTFTEFSATESMKIESWWRFVKHRNFAMENCDVVFIVDLRLHELWDLLAREKRDRKIGVKRRSRPWMLYGEGSESEWHRKLFYREHWWWFLDLSSFYGLPGSTAPDDHEEISLGPQHCDGARTFDKIKFR